MFASSIRDVNKKDVMGRTELHYATKHKDSSLIKQLLSQGARVDVRDRDETTPLLLAAIMNEGESHFEVAEILLKSGADPNAGDNYDLKPLHFLVRNDNVKFIQLFLYFKADLDVLDCNGCNLLFHAVGYKKCLEVVRFLINLGLDANHRNYYDGTPLHWACDTESKADVEVIKCLLLNGADANAADHKGCTPVFAAASDLYDDELGIKKLHFMMKHTDFSVICNSANILTGSSVYSRAYVKMILKHLAKLQCLNIPLHPDLLKTITENVYYYDYYKHCEVELLQTISTKLQNSWITYFNLLTDCRTKLKNYAGNEDLIEGFKRSECVQKFPIYGLEIKENVEKGIKRRKLFDKSSVTLSYCLPIFNPNHLIIKDVLNCILSKKNLSKFCG